MAPPNNTARKILKPKSIAQRVKDNQPTFEATSPTAETQRVKDNQSPGALEKANTQMAELECGNENPPTAVAPTSNSPMTEPERINQTTFTAVEDDTVPEGIKLVKLILPTLNTQTTAYLELKDKITITSSAATLADLQGASEVIQLLHSKLTTAISDHISAQAGIFFILSWPPSEFTTHNLLIISNGLRQVLKLVNSNIERIRGHVMNVEVLEEMKCGLKKMKPRCLFGHAEHCTELLRVLQEENEGVKREGERAGFVGPRRAEYVSLFPRKRGMVRLFCGEEEK